MRGWICSKTAAVCSTCMSTTGWKASAARLRKVLTNGGGTYSMSTATKNGLLEFVLDNTEEQFLEDAAQWKRLLQETAMN